MANLVKQVGLVAFVLLAPIADDPSLALTWGDGKSAALSLTYDDGYASQRNAASTLQAFGLRGTFYLSQAFPDVTSNPGEWKKVFAAGHEVGNHSFSHFCGIFPGNKNLKLKTWQDVPADVASGEEWLRSNNFSGGYSDHTYAYPCGEYVIGPGNGTNRDDPTDNASLQQARRVGTCEYAALLSEVVTAARTTDGGPNDPNDLARRRFFVAGQAVNNAQQAKEAIEAGISSGQWTVLIFHQVVDGGDELSITPSEHLKVL